VIEAAICCDPVSGTLDVVSKGGRPLREEIAKSFAERLLGPETTLTPLSRRDFDLSRLKRPAAFSTDPVDGVKSVEVTLLRAGGIGSGQRQGLTGPRDLHDCVWHPSARVHYG
jgi:hypothetical protein